LGEESVPQPDENRIRERAYQIWQQEGCPDGRDDVHWRMAIEQLASEEFSQAQTQPGESGVSGPMPGVPPPPAAAETRKPRATTRSPAKRNPQR
jgi:hypothetical protein